MQSREKLSLKLNDENLSPRQKRLNMLLMNMAMVLVVIFGSIWTVSWMLSDVTGEYTTEDPKLGTVRMSIVRRATNFKGELSCGSGALLEMNTPQLGLDKQVNLTFTLPQKWIDEGQEPRTVKFYGKFEEGTVSGVLREGSSVRTVHLVRNDLASIYRQIQSHMPFNG